MTRYHGLTACLALAACLLATPAAWAADPASVMPADLDYYVSLDLDAAQRAADQILPHFSRDYWARSEEPGAMGLAALAAAAPVIHAELTMLRSLVGPRVGVGVYGFADLYGAYVSAMLESVGEARAPMAAGKPRKRARPLGLLRTMLPHLDVVVAAEVRDPAQAKPLLNALAARQKRIQGKQLPALAVHVTEKWVVVAAKAARLEAVKAVMAGEQPALTSQSAYQEIVEALPLWSPEGSGRSPEGPEGGVAFFYADLAHYGPAMIEHLREATEKAWAEAEKGEESEEAENDETAQSHKKKGPGAMGPMMQQYMTMYWRLAADYYAATRGAGSAFYVDRGKVERRDVYLADPEKMAQVPVLGRLAKPAPMTGAALGALPATSLAAIAAGGAGKQLGAVLADVAELDPSLAMQVGMGTAMVGGFLGIDLDQTLLPAMERDVAVGLLALDVTGATPVQAAAVLQGRDEAAASALGASLDTVVAKRLKATLERGAIGSVAFRRLTSPNVPFDLFYAQLGDLLVVTTGKEALEACLQARADRRLALSAAPEIQRLMASACAASVLVFVRPERALSQTAPIVPPQVKDIIGETIGLDWAAFAVGGDAERQGLVMEMRGDVVTFAETLAQAVAAAARDGLLREAQPEPGPPPAPQHPRPAPPGGASD